MTPLRPPAEEGVAVGERLRVALRAGEDLQRMLHGARERRRPGLAVEADRQRARAAALPAEAVVEDADRAVGLRPRVVLEAEARPLAHLEARPLAADPRPDLAGGAVDLVDGVRVARGDEQVAVGLLFDGVQVEGVPRCAPPRDPAVGVGERHRAHGVPLEEHAPGRDVDLLDHAVGDASALGPTPRAQVPRAVVVGDDERGAARRERELVEVHPHAVAGPHARDDAVGRVGDDPFTSRRDRPWRCPPTTSGRAARRTSARGSRWRGDRPTAGGTRSAGRPRP